MILTTLLTLVCALQDDAIPREKLLELMGRCGEEITFHQEWDAAAQAAREKQGLVLVVHQMQGGYETPDMARLGAFMDPDIVGVVQQRFAVFEFQQGKQAPFVAQERYGVGPMSFGTSMLVADADGNVLDTTGDFGGTFYPFLVRNVARLEVGAPPADAGPLERAAWHTQRGELSSAWAALGRPTSARGWQLAGTLHRLEFEGERALTAFDHAGRLGGDEMAADNAVERSLVLLGLQRVAQAREVLEGIAADHSSFAQANYFLATVDFAQFDVPTGMQRFRSAIQRDPEDRWSWLAAGMTVLQPLLAQLGGGSSTAWPTAEALDLQRQRAWSRLPASRVDHAERTGVDFLLATQRPDGSWPSSMSGGAERGRDPFVIAVTSWAGRALLTRRSDPRCRMAYDRAAAFLVATRARLAQAGEGPGAMDYYVWSKPSLLLFGAEGVDAGALDDAVWVPLMDQVVVELRAKQREGGGWHYYKGFDLENLDSKLEISASFVTAFVLQALTTAEAVGVEVTQQMFDETIRCLEKTSNPDGTFEYHMMHANEDGPRQMTPSGAAGRGPLCTMALWQHGRRELEDVTRSLQSFVRFRENFAREHGKTLMHCGREGEGSHYLMFDYAWCAAAFSELGEAEQDQLRAPLLDQVLGARTDAGSYLDNPLMGDRFGTAAALWALERLRPRAEN